MRPTGEKYHMLQQTNGLSGYIYIERKRAELIGDRCLRAEHGQDSLLCGLSHVYGVVPRKNERNLHACVCVHARPTTSTANQ